MFLLFWIVFITITKKFKLDVQTTEQQIFNMFHLEAKDSTDI